MQLSLSLSLYFCLSHTRSRIGLSKNLIVKCFLCAEHIFYGLVIFCENQIQPFRRLDLCEVYTIFGTQSFALPYINNRECWSACKGLIGVRGHERVMEGRWSSAGHIDGHVVEATQS